MDEVWLFIDEQGDVKFGARNSQHFALAAVATRSPGTITASLDAIRHREWPNGHVSRGQFHAHDDCPYIQRAVLDAMRGLPLLRCDVAALRKDTIDESVRSPALMYRTAARALLRRAIPGIAGEAQALVVVVAEWAPLAAPDAVLRAVLTESWPDRPALWATDLVVVRAPAAAHGGLQCADYAAWAAHRQRTGREPLWSRYIESAGRATANIVVPPDERDAGSSG
ncbi:MAG: DUF3800 domain-containing protein [Dehalococcoidia bacterium]|nr:DUF3800 domain-containing protein [Dehalococcoidia bacterium]